MNLAIRLAIGMALSAVLFLVAFHRLGIPPDKYLPPASSYKNVTAETHGSVMSTEEKGYGDHVWGGMQTNYYVDYQFTPNVALLQPDGTTKYEKSTVPYTGSVLVDETTFRSATTGQDVVVKYDPYNPAINGVPNTLGVYSKTTGLMNPWLWYLIGFAALSVVFEEILKRWI